MRVATEISDGGAGLPWQAEGGVDRDDAPSGGGPLPHVYGRGWHGGIGDRVRARGKGWKAGRGGENDGAKDVGEDGGASIAGISAEMTGAGCGFCFE